MSTVFRSRDFIISWLNHTPHKSCTPECLPGAHGCHVHDTSLSHCLLVKVLTLVSTLALLGSADAQARLTRSVQGVIRALSLFWGDHQIANNFVGAFHGESFKGLSLSAVGAGVMVALMIILSEPFSLE